MEPTVCCHIYTWWPLKDPYTSKRIFPPPEFGIVSTQHQLSSPEKMERIELEDAMTGNPSIPETLVFSEPLLSLLILSPRKAFECRPIYPGSLPGVSTLGDSFRAWTSWISPPSFSKPIVSQNFCHTRIIINGLLFGQNPGGSRRPVVHSHSRFSQIFSH